MSDAFHAETLQRAVLLHQEGRLDAAEAGYRAVLDVVPDEVNALHLLGVLRLQQGRAEEAVGLIGRALEAAPDAAPLHNNHGNALAALGRFEDAEASYRRAASRDPGLADAAFNLGRLLRERGQAAEAVGWLDRVRALDPRSVEALNEQVLVWQALGRPAEAAAACRAALALAPDQAALHFNLGTVLLQSGDAAAAESSLRRALALQPGLGPAERALGDVLRARGRLDEAVALYRQALAGAPQDAGLRNSLGTALLRLDQPAAAEAMLGEAVALAPDQAEFRINHGNALIRLRRFEDALAAYRRAVELMPDSADAQNNLAGALSVLERREEAIAAYQRALVLRPGFADAAFNLGNVLQALKRFDAAAAAFRQALAIEPDHAGAIGNLLTVKRAACDWAGFAEDVAAIERLIDAGRPGIDPFLALTYPLSAARRRRCAEIETARLSGRIVPLPPQPRRAADRTLRLAYLSANFHGHAVGSLIAELIERHDRDEFSVTGISFGPDDGSALQDRLRHGFDRFIDVRGESDAAVAQRLVDLGIDIAIDLMGHTRDHRLGILAYRPAPVQVAFLGYPGTTGAPFIDYVIADPVVLPHDEQAFWSERIVHLPGCYQVNDGRRIVPAAGPDRAASGLPEAGFVFCCFNNSHKITPYVFAVWLRLLAAVPGSVLWLLRDNDDAARRLGAAAAQAGIDPARLVFAPVVAHELHLARQRLADLFVDTQPYTAHTTASDALRAGLPLVTCRGDSFAARVAASLLTALDMPELIAPDLGAYERLALDLAQDPARLAAVRARLSRNAVGAGLFDAGRFCIGLEAAYRRMIERQRQGLPPAGFDIAAG